MMKGKSCSASFIRTVVEITNNHYSGFGHDKSRTIRPYARLPADERPTLFYAGDGVSDLSAARETDLLFAKKGHGELPKHQCPSSAPC
jgi:2-hydroxy-3-keto-5-methylthiopentenyl-1-phosphate phosphatase